MKPYSDDFMIFDKLTNRYVLTEKDVKQNLGIEINVRLKNPEAVNSLLNQVSIQVYRFIHEHNIENAIQDYIIAYTETGRKIIKTAMEEQLIYVMTNGDLSRSTDKEKRKLWFDDNAREILMTPICELGTHLLYQGQFPQICIKDKG